MLRRSAKFVFALVALLVIPSCGGNQSSYFVAKKEPWRADDERMCLASGIVRDNPFVARRSALGGPDACGAIQPLFMSAAAQGRVSLKPQATLRCPMVPAVDHWVRTSVVPAARHFLGTDVVELQIVASYSCRPRNGIAGGRLSEHGHANALDVAGFVLADGRRVTVLTGWNGSVGERAFLRAVHKGACRTFTTVLGPHADAFHRDHFHLDLARHGKSGRVRICQ
jgi:hypothetical protein